MNIRLLEKIKTYEKVVLGFSGGADSMALSCLLLERNISFSAVHFNHHLRGESADEDAQFCKEFCNYNKIPFTLIDLEVLKNKQGGESIESTARRLRMEYWTTHFSNPKSAVLLAHHKDDLAENFLMRSMRGSSASGLSGLKEANIIDGVTYLRPLLEVTKNEICDFLINLSIPWCEDESNAEDIYSRNIVRNKVIPLLEKLGPIEGLYRTLENVSKDADFIETEAAKWLREKELNCENFKALHPALKPRVLRKYIFNETGKDFIPGHDAISRLDRELIQEHSENAIIPLGQAIFLTVATSGEIFIEPKAYEVKWDWRQEKEIILPGNIKLTVDSEISTCSETFKIDALSNTLTIRTWKQGDRMIPFSRKSLVKVKDLFSDRKLSHLERKKVPLIFSDDQLIWIPTVRRAEFGLIEKDSKSITISYEKL